MRKTGLDVAASVARGLDRILDMFIGFALVVAVLFGGYGLWDSYLVYQNASSTSLAGYKPKGDGDGGSSPTFAELQALNSDVCAWITVDGTSIDYPVLQGEDNYEYLNKDVYGEFSFSGSIFLDEDNSRDFTDAYSLLYGHHMEGEVMFGELPNFLEDDYFEEHATGTLYLPDSTYSIDWFCCIYTDAYDNNVFDPIQGQDTTAMESLQSYLMENARQYRNIGLLTSDQLIGLSTCSDATTDGRVLLFGRLSKAA